MRLGEIDAERDRAIGDRVRKRHVAVSALLAAFGLVGAVDNAGCAGSWAVDRPVLLGKQDVERNRGDIGLRQVVDEIRHRLARPRPSTDEMERLVVDVDDPHGLIERIRPRKPALILVEDEVLQIGAHRRGQGSDGERQDIGAHDDQPVGSPLPHGVVRPEVHRIGDGVGARAETSRSPIVAERSAGSTEARGTEACSRLGTQMSRLSLI